CRRRNGPLDFDGKLQAAPPLPVLYREQYPRVVAKPRPLLFTQEAVMGHVAAKVCFPGLGVRLGEEIVTVVVLMPHEQANRLQLSSPVPASARTPSARSAPPGARCSTPRGRGRRWFAASAIAWRPGWCS